MSYEILGEAMMGPRECVTIIEQQIFIQSKGLA